MPCVDFKILFALQLTEVFLLSDIKGLLSLGSENFTLSNAETLKFMSNEINATLLGYSSISFLKSAASWAACQKRL